MSACAKRPKLIETSDNARAKVADPTKMNAAADRKVEVNLSFSSRPIANADDNIAAEDRLFCKYNELSIHEMNNKLIASMLGFHYRDIMRARICCSKFRDAAKSTIVPWANNTYERRRETEVKLQSHFRSYKAMVVMSHALPKLQQLTIRNNGVGKYLDGNDPDKVRATRTASWTAYDIRMISNFQHLQELVIWSNTLNGRYPFLFDFPLLKRLEINSKYLKWDLSVLGLGGMPLLTELDISGNVSDKSLTAGSIKSLDVLKGTLESVRLCGSEVKGDIMDLTDFPHLNHLDLSECPKIIGDLRDIKDGHFLALKTVCLSERIIGSFCHQFHSISDVPSTMEAIYRLSQEKTPFVEDLKHYSVYLSGDSSDRYDSSGKEGHPDPPFCISFIRVGPRIGWRWKTLCRYGDICNSCEVNWLNPEPSRDSSDHTAYIEKLESIEEDIFCFEGYHQPPTEEE